jgi:type II secretory pathway component GspD/PulD (secretin)
LGAIITLTPCATNAQVKQKLERRATDVEFRYHTVPGDQAESIAKLMREVFACTPVTIVALPPDKIGVWADAGTQINIVKLFTVQRPRGEAAVIQLEVLRAATMEKLLKATFAKADDLFIEADLERKAIRVRGTKEQVRAVREEIGRIENVIKTGDKNGPPSVRFHDVPKGSAEGIAKVLSKRHNDPTIRIAVINSDRVFVYASDEKTHQEIYKQIRLLADAFEIWQPKDEPKKAEPKKESNPLIGPPDVRFYSLPSDWIKALQAIYPEAKIQPINSMRLFVYADPQTHLEISKIVDLYSRPLGQLVSETIQLKYLDAQMFVQTLGRQSELGFKIGVDEKRNVIIVTAPASQIQGIVKEIKSVIAVFDVPAEKK